MCCAFWHGRFLVEECPGYLTEVVQMQSEGASRKEVLSNHVDVTPTQVSNVVLTTLCIWGLFAAWAGVSGESTILELLAGTRTPMTGRVTADGDNAGRWSPGQTDLLAAVFVAASATAPVLPRNVGSPGVHTKNERWPLCGRPRDSRPLVEGCADGAEHAQTARGSP